MAPGRNIRTRILNPIRRRNGSQSQSPAPSRSLTVQSSLPPPSQSSQLTRADDHEFQSRLQTLPPAELEAELRARKFADDSDLSIWDYLYQPNGIISPAQAASDILISAVDKTERISVEAAYLWRWVQLKSLWSTHPDPALRNERAFAEKIDGGSGVARIMLVIGTSTEHVRRVAVSKINAAWGPDWFDKIPLDVRPPSATKATDLSKRILQQISISAENGLDFDSTVHAWSAAISRRLDPWQRAAQPPGKQQSMSPNLVLVDAETVNKNESLSTRTSTTKEDRLELKPLNRASRKRKQNDPPIPGGENGPAGEVDLNERSKWRVKKIRNHLIREPITQSSPEASASASDNDEIHPSKPVSSPRLSPPPPVSASQREHLDICHGLDWLSHFRHLIEYYSTQSDGLDTSDRVGNCCDICREHVLRALAALRVDLLPALTLLEAVENHVIDGRDIPAGAINDSALPKKRLRQQCKKIVLFSSDEDASDEDL